jgi:hypothetical protein
MIKRYINSVISGIFHLPLKPEIETPAPIAGLSGIGASVLVVQLRFSEGAFQRQYAPADSRIPPSLRQRR